jgi:hypothetical protein
VWINELKIITATNADSPIPKIAKPVKPQQ